MLYGTALEGFINGINRGNENILDDFEKKCPELCTDEGFAKYITGRSTAIVLDHASDEADAHFPFVQLSITVLAANIMYSFIPRSKGKCIGPESESYAKRLYYRKRIFTTKGVIVFLDKHTDCYCLDELVVKAKPMERTRSYEICSE